MDTSRPPHIVYLQLSCQSNRWPGDAIPAAGESKAGQIYLYAAKWFDQSEEINVVDS